MEEVLASEVLNLVGGILQSVVGAVVNGAVSLAVSAVKGVVTAAVSIVTGAFRLAASALGALVQAIGAAFMSVLHGILALPGLLLNVFDGLRNIIGSVIGALARFASFILGLAAGALGAFAAAVAKAVHGALEFSKAVLSLRGQTGMSYAAAGGFIRDYASLGLSKDEAAGIVGDRNPYVTNMMASQWGLPSFFDPAKFLPAFASKYQQYMSQGMQGQFMAHAMLQAVGQGNPALRSLAMLPPDVIANQIAFSRGTYSRLGLGGNTTQENSEGLQMQVNRVGVLWDALSSKLEQVVLPVLERLLTVVNNVVAGNADKIGAFLEQAMETLVVKAPTIIADFVNNFLAGLDAGMGYISEKLKSAAQMLPQLLGGVVQWLANLFISLANWMTQNLPRMIKALANTISNLGNWLADRIDDIGQFLTSLENPSDPFRQFLEGIAGFVDDLNMSAAIISGGLAAFFASIKNAVIAYVQMMPGIGPLATAAMTALGWNTPSNPATAFNTGYNAVPGIDAMGILDAGLNANARNHYGATVSGWAKTLRRASNSAALDIQNYGLAGVSYFSGKLNNAANVLAPPGQPNLGVQAGTAVADKLNAFAAYLDASSVRVQAFEATAKKLESAAGTEQERREWWSQVIGLLKEQNNLQREALRVGAGAPQYNEIAAAMLNRWVLEEAGAIRRSGVR